MILDIVTIQAVFHVAIAVLYATLAIGTVSHLSLSRLGRLFAVIVGCLAAFYRLDTAWYVWHASREDAGFSGTTAALVINANILAFAVGFLLILLMERKRDD